MTKIRAFNNAGLNEFRTYLTRLKEEATLEPPRQLLEDFRYTDFVPGEAKIEPRAFASKLEFGRYISQVVGSGVADRVLRTSVGLWAWLVLFYIDQTCPRDGNGRRKVLRLEK